MITKLFIWGTPIIQIITNENTQITYELPHFIIIIIIVIIITSWNVQQPTLHTYIAYMLCEFHNAETTTAAATLF